MAVAMENYLEHGMGLVSGKDLGTGAACDSSVSRAPSLRLRESYRLDTPEQLGNCLSSASTVVRVELPGGGLT